MLVDCCENCTENGAVRLVEGARPRCSGKRGWTGRVWGVKRERRDQSLVSTTRSGSKTLDEEVPASDERVE